MLLNRKPSPIETINDLNGDIVNFFRVLRDRGDELIFKLSLTPYSKEEFKMAWEPSDCEVERARRWYVRVQMDVAKAGSKKDRSWSKNVTYVKGAYSSAVKNFHTKIPKLINVVERLKKVQVENIPALEFIEKYDTKDTLFYCDPPYMPAVRKTNNNYAYEMKMHEHYKLSQKLNSVKGLVCLSCYYDYLYQDWYKSWYKVEFKSKKPSMSKGSGHITREVLLLNFQPNNQLQLF